MFRNVEHQLEISFHSFVRTKESGHNEMFFANQAGFNIANVNKQDFIMH